MSLFTQAMLFEQYGGRLDLDALEKVLGWKKNTMYNMVAQGSFPVKTYLDGGKRWADYRDVAEYLDEQRKKAA